MKKPHYYYRIAATSKAGEKLQKFFNKCQEAEEMAREWAEKIGASGYYESPEGMAGGVGTVEFSDNAEHDGWDREETPDGRVLYFPIVGSDLEEEMNALPVVSELELIDIMNLVPNFTDKNLPMPMTFGHSTPIIFLHHGYWYADIPYASAELSVERIEEKEFYSRKMAATNVK